MAARIGSPLVVSFSFFEVAAIESPPARARKARVLVGTASASHAWIPGRTVAA
jgi:hypothetical protein